MIAYSKKLAIVLRQTVLQVVTCISLTRWSRHEVCLLLMDQYFQFDWILDRTSESKRILASCYVFSECKGPHGLPRERMSEALHIECVMYHPQCFSHKTMISPQEQKQRIQLFPQQTKTVSERKPVSQHQFLLEYSKVGLNSIIQDNSVDKIEESMRVIDSECEH